MHLSLTTPCLFLSARFCVHLSLPGLSIPDKKDLVPISGQPDTQESATATKDNGHAGQSTSLSLSPNVFMCMVCVCMCVLAGLHHYTLLLYWYLVLCLFCVPIYISLSLTR